MLRAVPFTWRRKLVVAAAADYFFDKHWKAVLAALSLNAIPIDRESTGRRSADLDPRARRRRVEPRHLPRRWPLTRRLGAGVQGRCGVPVEPHRRTGGAGVHRRHRLDLRQGHEAAQAGTVTCRVRDADAARRRANRRAASTPASMPPSRRSPTRRPPTTGRLGGALPPARARSSAARSTRDGAGSGISPPASSGHRRLAPPPDAQVAGDLTAASASSVENRARCDASSYGQNAERSAILAGDDDAGADVREVRVVRRPAVGRRQRLERDVELLGDQRRVVTLLDDVRAGRLALGCPRSSSRTPLRSTQFPRPPPPPPTSSWRWGR